MKKILSLCLAAALCAPAFAQKMGMSNENAPTMQQSLTMGDAKMSLDYTSITWADGKTLARAADKEKGAPVRKRINDTGPENPLATFKTSIDVTCGDLQLPAGEHKVYFTINEDLSWNINFKMGDKVQTMKLKLEDSGHESKRMLLCLYAEEKGAGVYMAFGKQSGMLSFTPGAAPKK